MRNAVCFSLEFVMYVSILVTLRIPTVGNFNFVLYNIYQIRFIQSQNLHLWFFEEKTKTKTCKNPCILAPVELTFQ